MWDCQLITDFRKVMTCLSENDKLNKIIYIIKIIKTNRIIRIIKNRMIKIMEILKWLKKIKIIKSIMSCMSFLFEGQWSTDKILSLLVYILIVLFPVWAGINNSVSCFETK